MCLGLSLPVDLPLPYGSRALWRSVMRAGHWETYHALSIILMRIDRRILGQPKANLSSGISDRFGLVRIIWGYHRRHGFDTHSPGRIHVLLPLL